jgi:hypothetical protein
VFSEAEVAAAARDVAAAAAAAPTAAAADGGAAAAREHAARSVEALASQTSGPVAEALSLVAGYARGEWPEDGDLPKLGRVAADLAGLQRVHDELTADALSRVAEVEAARGALADDLTRLVAATSAAGEDTAVGRLTERVAALETHLSNLSVRLERGASAAAAPGRPGAAGGGDGSSSSVTTGLVNDLRGRVSRLEADNGLLRSRLSAVEGALAHLERVLEAAAGFAAQDAAAAAAAGGGR